MALSLAERRKRAKIIRGVLEKLYPDPKPPLDSHDAFTLMTAVMLSAQSTDVLVNQVTPELFRLAPTPEKMAALGESQIYTLIKRVNYNATKAKNLKKMADMLLKDFNAEVPKTFEELERLPGIGHKTASVVMSQSFGIPAFPVDTHIHRLAQRWKLSNGKNVEKTEADLKEVFPEETWNTLHLQIIFYGREYCKARGCDGHTCKLCKRLNGS